MSANSKLRPYLIRLAIAAAIALAFAALFNEATFLLQKTPAERAPKTIQIVVPPGTAERIQAGEETPFIPEEMVFVVGDILEVINQDAVSHQLGPVWVPAGATGSLMMNQVERVRYSCSFQSQQFLGLDIRQPVTLKTRLTGLLMAAPTLTALFFVYSLAAYPIDKKKAPAKDQKGV
ncbi:MAG: hypothetical protein M5U05_11365 [Anaerolineales bacterium]|jgi:hypothetical protein|nr:hypothetical protein [Anaerolineales bacterium]